MSESFSSRINNEEARKKLIENINSVESELKLIGHSLSKNDLLRVSNFLLASERMAGAVSRQAFIEELASWGHTLEKGVTKKELKNLATNFQAILEREHEKHRFDIKLASIQNSVEKGFYNREVIAEMLRNLADEVINGDYPILLDSKANQGELSKKYLKSLGFSSKAISKIM